MSILSEILANKRTEVALKREHAAPQELQERLKNAPALRDFRAALRAGREVNGIALIAEVKKASPSKGIICENFDPLAIARTYAENGASCLSVLTDEKYFQGHLNYLAQIREIVSLPLLRKDFIVDGWQIAESRGFGADAILLIVAALSPPDLRNFLQLTRESGMAALVEVHDRDEMDEALDAGADLIGINNRDLHTFRTSLAATLDLMVDLSPDANRLIVSESGIFTAADVARLRTAGADAFLVGEALMRETDIGAKMREMLGAS